MRLRDIYLYLADNNEVFDPEDAETYAVRDLDIVDVEVSKNDEQSFWTASVKVRNPGGGWYSPTAKTRAIITERDQETGEILHVITGRLEGWPVGMAGQIVTLTLMAAAPITTPDNESDGSVKREDLEDDALDGISDDPYSLFTRTAVTERRSPEERLGGRYAALNWPRNDTTAPTLVDLVAGDGYLDLAGNWIEGTLSFQQSSTQPTTKVEVTISAEWENSFLQVIDLADAVTGDISLPDNPMIDQGVFGTLNNSMRIPLNLGDKIADWTVIENGVIELDPAGYSIDPLSPEYETSVRVSPKNDPSVKKAYVETYERRFQRHILQLFLKVAGVVTARRKETVTFTVAWGGQLPSNFQGVTDKVELSCSNLRGYIEYPDHAPGIAYGVGARVMIDGLKWEAATAHISSDNFYADIGYWFPVMLDEAEPVGGPAMPYFFGAPEEISVNLPNGGVKLIFRSPAPGLTALRYGYGQAIAKMMNSLRLNASFDVPWPLVRHLVGSERIRIADPDIAGGEMVGKIVSISASLISQRAKITIASIPGKDGTVPAIAQPVYGFRALPLGRCTGASIAKDYTWQEAMLEAHQYPLRNDLLALIGSNPTSFNFSLSPIPKGGDLEVTIPMGTYVVDTDKMIDLEAA